MREEDIDRAFTLLHELSEKSFDDSCLDYYNDINTGLFVNLARHLFPPGTNVEINNVGEFVNLGKTLDKWGRIGPACWVTLY